MQRELLVQLIFGLLGFLTFAFLFVALKRARQRRLLQFQDIPSQHRPQAEEDKPVEIAGNKQDETQPACSDESTSTDASQTDESIAADTQIAAEELKVDANYKRLENSLSRTRQSFWSRASEILRQGEKLDSRVVETIEDSLLTADVGVAFTNQVIKELYAQLKSGQLLTINDVRVALKKRLRAVFAAITDGGIFEIGAKRPYVILFVGVNGVGKTTTMGKLATVWVRKGLKVVLAAGDTFRAAAVEQLQIWGERSGAQVIRGDSGADPAAVVFNALEYAKSSGQDVVLADTAGRLHTRTNLMDELKKIKRALAKSRADAPDEVWLIVDATTGQNAVQQAREFHQALGLSGVILTKLDGTAKGGVIVAIADALHLPVRFIGVGEGIEDLQPFNPGLFIEALMSEAPAAIKT